MNLENLKVGDDFCPNKCKGSFGIITNEIFKADLTSTSKLMWSKLAQYARQDTYCFPRQSLLAKDLNIDERTVRNSLDELETKGFIRVERPKNGYLSTHKSNRYYFIVHPCFIKDTTLLPCEGGKKTLSPNQDISPESLEKETKYGSLIEAPLIEALYNSSKEELASDFIASKVPLVSRKLNRGSNVSFVEENIPNLPTQETNQDFFDKDSKPVRKLVRGFVKDPPTENKLSLLDKYAQMQDASYQVPPTPIVPKLPPIVVEILSYWNKHSGATVHKLPNPGEMPTNTVKKSCKLIKKLLKGKLFVNISRYQHFTDIVTQSDIEEAIDLLHERITNLNILPIDKRGLKRITFPRFIYDEILNISNFVECFNKEIVNANDLCKDPVVKPIYEAMKESYGKYFTRDKDFTVNEMRKFILGAKRLINKMEELSGSLYYFETTGRLLSDPDLWTDWVMEGLISQFGRNASINTLGSSYVYDHCLIRYLEKKNILSTEEKDIEYSSGYDEEEVIQYQAIDPEDFECYKTIQMEEY
jgi:hypothetical protein